MHPRHQYARWWEPSDLEPLLQKSPSLDPPRSCVRQRFNKVGHVIVQNKGGDGFLVGTRRLNFRVESSAVTCHSLPWLALCSSSHDRGLPINWSGTPEGSMRDQAAVIHCDKSVSMHVCFILKSSDLGNYFESRPSVLKEEEAACM